MKHFFFFFAVSLTTALAARSEKSIHSSYVVISDVYSKDIPAGKCAVIGKVFSPEYSEKGQLPLPGARVSTLNGKSSATTDTEGNYKMLIDSKDTTIYMFYSQYEEIVIWKYLFKSQHIVTINFYPNYDPQMMQVDKPVIYLYSDKELDATVHFASKGAVTFTYPKYVDSWRMRVGANGLRDAETGRCYPYLFWEAETADLNFKFEENGLKAFIIKTDTVVSFLENSLTAMGLNQTEQTDFITFWAPRIISTEYALVQFLTGDDYTEKISSLTISPTPDKLLRVFMLFSPMVSDHLPMKVEVQQFEVFDRSGFTVVEWGGSELSPLQIIP